MSARDFNITVKYGKNNKNINKTKNTVQLVFLLQNGEYCTFLTLNISLYLCRKKTKTN